MPDISGIIANTGVQLEAQAFKTFGAAVANQAGGLLSSIFSSGSAGQTKAGFASPNPGEIAVWDPTPYASALASGSGGFDPKVKFLFKVTFRFIPDISQEIADLFGIANDGKFAANLTFTLKQIDMPKYKFEYEEVNMYNFRTQILKKVTHDELGFMMYDTAGNHALNFVNAYLQLLVPASRQQYTTGYDLWNHGFAFTASPADGNDTSSRAVLGHATSNTAQDGAAINVLDTMTIDQYYLSRDQSAGLKGANIVNAIKVNSYVFTNPKLTHFEVGDQDHEKGAEPSMITCGFMYDTLYIQTGQSGADVAANRPSLAGGDLLSNVVPAGASVYRSPVVGSGGGGSPINPFLAAFAGAAGRTISQSVTQILAKSGLANSPGGGLAISGISGAVGTNAARTLASLGSTSPGISLPSAPVIIDNSASISQTANLSSQNAAAIEVDV
jgi:hypothetical protein